MVVGDPNRATQASYWATGLLSMLPTTCWRHWLTVHSASATLNGATAGILMNECKRAETTRYGAMSAEVNERGRGRGETSRSLASAPLYICALYSSQLEPCACG